MSIFIHSEVAMRRHEGHAHCILVSIYTAVGWSELTCEAAKILLTIDGLPRTLQIQPNLES